MPAITATKPPERAARFAEQLTDKLATFTSDSARLAFLRPLARAWEEKYDRWTARVDCGREELTADGPTAFDFVSTIAEIQIAIGRLEKLAA